MRSRREFALAALLTFGCSSEHAAGPSASTSGKGGGSNAGASNGAGGGGGSAPVGPIAGTVTQYRYAFDLATAHAHADLEVAVAAPGGDCFSVSYGLPSVGAVRWNGGDPTSATLAAGALDVCGPGVTGTLALGAEVDVLQKNFFNLDVGYSHRKDMDGGKFSYLLSWIGGCDRFGPCDADPSRLTSFHFEITHAPGDVVLCPGTLTPGATVTTCDVAGAPTYSAFGFAADPLWKRTPFATIGPVDLVFYEVPSGGIAKALDKASVTTFFTWVTGLLGPFPYGKELRYAGGPTAWLGFEHPANILLNQDLPTMPMAYNNPPMHVLMHETVHQWAGDRSTLATTPDFVWKEATAEYLAYVFEDEHRPPVEAAASLAYWDTVSLQSAHYPRPTDMPAPAVESFYGDVYGPGPMVLYVQLETMLGRTTVLAGIKAFLAEPGARAVRDLQKSLEAASGKDLAAYFDAWVFGTGAPEWPTFEVTTQQTADQVTVTVMQKNASGKVYGCSVEVEVAGATTKAIAHIDFGLAPKGAKATAVVTLSEAVKSTLLDPSHRLVGRLAGAPALTKHMPVWLL